MIIRANDASGDWLWGQNQGDILTGQEAVEQNVQTSLLCFQNDCFWNMSFGVDWFNLLALRNPAAENGIILQTRQVIIQSFGITAINAIDVLESAATRAIQLIYDLSSIFSSNFAGNATPLS